MQLSRDFWKTKGHQEKHDTFHHSVVLSFKGKYLKNGRVMMLGICS